MNPVKLSYKVSPKLLITPQLKQALYILQLPVSSLKEYLEQKISKNPLLQPSKEDLETEVEKLLNLDNSTYYAEKNNFSGTEELPEFPEIAKSNTLSLQEYLRHQLNLAFLNEEELTIAEELINYIDTNGYLRISLEKLSEDLKLPLDKLQKVLETIQSLEPSGVGARNLQECLFIQLKNNDQKDSLAFKIVQSCFKELSRKDYDLITKRLNVSLDNVKEAIKSITALSPKPGAFFSQDENISIIPDVTVEVNKNRLNILFNEEELPNLRINNQYKKLLKDCNTSDEIRQFIKERLKEAVWLIKAVEQRQKNLQKVTQAILQLQKQAILTDFSNIKPLTLKDIAKKTDLHLSTIGRIVTNKYISTPQGIIRLKSLFSAKFKSNDGVIYSDKNILSKIQHIINTEDKKKPFTDQAICNILKESGIQISRRTVAKYRDKLKIPPSFLR